MRLFFGITYFAVLLSLTARADSCRPFATQNLSLTNALRSSLIDPVDVTFDLQGSNLLARFEVRTKMIHGKPELGPNEYPFHFDVVELFVSVAGPLKENTEYFEFQLTPYNQTSQVKIWMPKRRFIDGQDFGLKTTTNRTAGGWIGEMSIPLENLGWNGRVSNLVGNAFGILGKPPQRSYWSRSLPPQKKPNFHLPQHFLPLFDCRSERELH